MARTSKQTDRLIANAVQRQYQIKGLTALRIFSADGSFHMYITKEDTLKEIKAALISHEQRKINALRDG